MKNISIIFVLLLVLISSNVRTAPGNAVILVYPFQNTGDTKYSWVSAGMTDTVISDLNRLKNITIISESDRKKAVMEIELGMTGIVSEKTITGVGELIGATTIFTGSYLVVDNAIRVNAKIINVSTGALEKSIKIDGAMDDIFRVQDKIIGSLMDESKQLNKTANITFGDAEKNIIADKYNPAVTAYEYYSKGLEIIDTNPKEALKYFKKAGKKDSEYFDAFEHAGFVCGVYLNEYDDAMEYFNRAEEILKNKNKTKSEDSVKLLISYANTVVVRGMKYQDQALQYLDRANEIMTFLGLTGTQLYAKVLKNYGDTYLLTRGAFKKALEYYLQSQEIFEKLGLTNTMEYGSLMLNMGSAYGYGDDHKNAVEHWDYERQLLIKYNMKESIAYADLAVNLGSSYVILDEADKGFVLQNEAKLIFEKMKMAETNQYAGVLYSMGLNRRSLWMRKKDKNALSESCGYYRQAMEIFNRNKYEGGMIFLIEMQLKQCE